ncbi:prepilin-type N-terminal cleavage/methylation domain-containing protein [Candidatus Nomurabacteria bacterium]|nr:prepilin-type N-terminal cleavage/methylation domain-containing protein [Candidatus Nomurabacteria bacterium]
MKKIFAQVQAGFTLMEVMMVIAIIGILTAVTLSSLNDSQDEAKIASAEAQLRSMRTAMDVLYNDSGKYPHGYDRYCPPGPRPPDTPNEIDLSTPEAGIVATDGSHDGWRGPYMREAIDPWGHPYFFDEDYFCTPGARGCDGLDSDASTIVSALVSCGLDGDIGTDSTANSGPGHTAKPDNGDGCAYDNDNVVYILCHSE